ncbi:HD domain-containing protein [Shewanella avicenniae]|uniref:HD domain-containing protein n=1 Tax=Shewanella avicenniae TaxID=2814294 RepID=A0ABX7QPK5_9GAMM|nr:HD domain-containing phosphohydrolase [Shewanella avicenniae]QSX33407.1 HD domain-containing protein [Shewanella avicenniae]
MDYKFEQWKTYLAIDDHTISTLQQNYWIIEQHIDEIVDKLYDKLTSFEGTKLFYEQPEAMMRAKQHQKRYWKEYVFKGNLDQSYIDTSKRIGRTHHKIGVDMHFYTGAYNIMMRHLVRKVREALGDDIEQEFQYLSALNKVIFMDMGLTTSVYYNSVASNLEKLATELNMALARAGEFRDNETGQHIHRMSRMSAELAKCIGKDSQWCNMILLASPLHDVGKIGIPDNVLLKPGKLTEQEWVCMKSHPQIGGEIVPQNNTEVIQMARRIALTHHERWDGTGYPLGLSGEAIPLEGRIAAVCDVFDALLSVRPYKAAWSVEDAANYLKQNSGQHFDPELVEIFLANLPRMMEIQHQFKDADEVDEFNFA